MLFLAGDDDVILKYNKSGEKFKSYLVLNLIVRLFMMKNTLKPEKKRLRTKLLPNLQTMKFQKKIIMKMQFVLVL